MSAAPALQGLLHVAIKTADLARTRRFYLEGGPPPGLSDERRYVAGQSFFDPEGYARL